MKENMRSPWKRSLFIGAIESIAILPFLPFIGSGNPWVEVPVFAVGCSLFYVIGMWAAPRMMRILRWVAVVPILYIVYLLTSDYAVILAAAYLFSRGGKHQGQWQFLYWLGGFLFHLIALLWIVRMPEMAGYVPLLWGSAFISVSLFLLSFQRQLLRDAAVYDKLITSETLRVGFITVTLIIIVATLLSVFTWSYVGERMVSPLTNFADSFKQTLTYNLGSIAGNLSYPMPQQLPQEDGELRPTSLFIKIVWNLLGGFLMPVTFIGMIVFAIYLNRKEIRAFLFQASAEKEQDTLLFTEERRSLRTQRKASATTRPFISKEEWSRLSYGQKVRELYRLIIWHWVEKGNVIHSYDTPRELGVRMKDPKTMKFMDAYSQVKYAAESKERLRDEELEGWFTSLNNPR